MMTWGRTYGAAMPPTPQANLALIDQLGMQLPSLMFSGELWLLTCKSERRGAPNQREAMATPDREAASREPQQPQASPRPWSAG